MSYSLLMGGIPLLAQMPLALSIQPFSKVLDMYGDADSSSTFSLSGHVSVSLTSPSSLFVRRNTTTRILLRSLTITFEGQSETLSPGTGYAPIRLCSITRELLPQGPVDISNEGHEDSNTPCLWNVVFDIAVPGWLPTTSAYGDASLQATGTSYGLYAVATFVDANHGHRSFFLANICGFPRSRTRTVSAQRFPIKIRRFVEPQSGFSSSLFPISSYTVEAHREPDSEDPSRRSIPNHVLEKIRVIANIPSTTAMDETSVPFTLRVHGKDLDDFERNRLKVTNILVDVEQVEVYRNNSGRCDDARYPIPSQAYQPPRVPLPDPHPIHVLYDVGFLGTFGSSVKRSFSILAPTESGRYIISGDRYISNSGHSPSSENDGYILETKIPILTEPYMHDWAGAQERRITESSPLFDVEHYIHVVVCFEYDLADETIPERLHFSLPMKYANVPEISIPCDATQNQCEDGKLPEAQTLPAYSQLFHPNGERKQDYSIPLPLYEAPSSSEFTSDERRML